MSAEVENSLPTPSNSNAAVTAAPNSTPPTSPITSKVPFKREKKKGWAEEAVGALGHAGVEIKLPFSFGVCSVGKDGRVPAGQVSRRWSEVQGQADRHGWRSRGQRRQDVPGLHDETQGAASEYQRMLCFRDPKKLVETYNRHCKWTMLKYTKSTSLAHIRLYILLSAIFWAVIGAMIHICDRKRIRIKKTWSTFTWTLQFLTCFHSYSLVP